MAANCPEGEFLEIGTSAGYSSFAFLDAEKEVYEQCYDLIIPRLIKGG